MKMLFAKEERSLFGTFDILMKWKSVCIKVNFFSINFIVRIHYEDKFNDRSCLRGMSII